VVLIVSDGPSLRCDRPSNQTWSHACVPGYFECIDCSRESDGELIVGIPIQNTIDPQGLQFINDLRLAIKIEITDVHKSMDVANIRVPSFQWGFPPSAVSPRILFDLSVFVVTNPPSCSISNRKR